MNREILFIGKRVDNGEWVEGYYVKARHHWHKNGVHEDWIVTSATQNGGWFTINGRFPVIPETVGQYSGMGDKNGTKIFEGHKLNVVTSDMAGEPLYGTEIVTDITNYAMMEFLDHANSLEVIGTIHDKEESK